MADFKLQPSLPVLLTAKAKKRMAAKSNANAWALILCTENEDLMLSCSENDQYSQGSETALPLTIAGSAIEKTNVDFSVSDIVKIQGKSYVVDSLDLSINKHGFRVYIRLNAA